MFAGATEVTTLAGSGVPGTADGTGADAKLDNPANIVLLPGGDLLIADFDNGALRQMTPSGDVTTVLAAGMLTSPFGLVVSDAGEVYVETDGNAAGVVTRETGSIWRVDVAAQTVTLIIENIGRPRGMAALPGGNLLLADPAHHTIRILDPEGPSLTLLAGAHDDPGCDDGTGASARFNQPYGLAALASGDFVVADQLSHRIRRITPAGQVTTFAGEAAPGMVDGDALDARFNLPQDVAVDALGNVFVSDMGNHRLRRIDTAGIVTTVAGSGVEGFADGAESVAQFFGQEGIEASNGFIYVADGTRGLSMQPYHRVRVLLAP